MAKNGKHAGGRPVGSLSQRTKALRAISDEALAAGITPFEVMLNNMRFYYEKADVLLTAILVGIDKKKKPMEMLEALKELGSFRDKAQACAVDAAPYAHSRLTATTADVTVTHKVEEAEAAFKIISGTFEKLTDGEEIKLDS